MERLSKAKFLELLQKVGKEDTSKSQRTGSNQQRNDNDDGGGKEDRILKAKPKESRKPNWDVLTDDYMMGARLKDNL